MRFLVTGGTGFVGSHIVEWLLADGDSVVVAKRETSNLRWLPIDKIELIDAPVDQPEPLRRILSEVDGVVHAAGLTKAKHTGDFHRINAEGTRRLLELCGENCENLKRFVLVSSQAASCPGNVDNAVCETTPEGPLSAYGRSKLAAEQIVKEFAPDIPVSIIRPPTVYGPRDTNVFAYFRLVNRGLLPFAGDPDRQFSIIYVKDLAKSVSILLRKSHESGSVYFVSDGEVHTWRKFGEAVAKALGKNPVKLKLPKWAFWPVAAVAESAAKISGKPTILSFEKVREMSVSWVCDDSLIRRELEFESEYDLARGIEETVDWYRTVGWL